MDINLLYESGKAAIKSSKFKYETQKYEMDLLKETVRLYEDLKNCNYSIGKCRRFQINERGKIRNIASNMIRDRAVNHYLCDNFINPALSTHIIYDNSVSQSGKGLSFARERIEKHLHRYYINHKNNDGYILLMDFKNYYGNIPHDKCYKIFQDMISDPEVLRLAKLNIDSFLNDTGIEMGNQLAQSIGIIYPYKIDNYIKIVCGIKYYGRYADDSYIICESKEKLWNVLNGVRKIADNYGIVINEKKTHIVRLSKPFRYLQIQYCLTDTGRLIKKINPKALTRERRRLKAHKRQLDKGRMTYDDIENCYKSWMGNAYKIMSKQQINNIKKLYFFLFRKEPRWKK